MKPFALAFSAALLSAVLTTALLTIFRDERPTRPETSARAQGLAAAPAAAAAQPTEARLEDPDPIRRDELEALWQRLAGLEAELASLTRTPVAVVESEPQKDSALASGDEAASFVLDVVERDREEREARDRAERQQRMADLLAERADKMAAELGLSGKEETAVYGILLEENERRTAAFEAMREGGFRDRNLMREEMQGIREWKNGEFANQLGSDLAERVESYERANDNGFGRFGGGGGGDGGRRGETGDQGGGGRGRD